MKRATKTSARGKSNRHPKQPVEWDGNGVIRFKENAIVRYLLDNGGIDMNHLARVPFLRSDRVQFAQLIGYSVSGFGELSYVDGHDWASADRARRRLLKEQPKDPEKKR